MRLQHRPVPDDDFRDRTVVVRPRFQVQSQIRGIGFYEQRFFRRAGFVSLGSGRDHNARRRASHLVVGYDVRLIRLTARQILNKKKKRKSLNCKIASVVSS